MSVTVYFRNGAPPKTFYNVEEIEVHEECRTICIKQKGRGMWTIINLDETLYTEETQYE